MSRTERHESTRRRPRRQTRGLTSWSTTERKSTFFTRWTLVGCLALVLAAPGWAAAQSRFSGIVVFGTSLSDPGNAFVLGGDASTPPDFMLNPLLIPSAPYARGGHHFSNGATWVEQYREVRRLGGSVRPALATTDPRAHQLCGRRRQGLRRRHQLQPDAAGGHVPPTLGRRGFAEALYVIEMGSNDIRDAFQVYATGGNGGPILPAGARFDRREYPEVVRRRARGSFSSGWPERRADAAIRSLGPAAGGLATT